MKKRTSWMSAALAAVAVTGFSSVAAASSHSEAPGTAADPEIDNTDVWAWRHGNNLIVVAGYNGLQVPYAAPNWKKFSQDALYEIHIARGGTSLADKLKYQIKFETAPYPQVDPADMTKPLGGGKEFFTQISGGGPANQTYSVTKVVGNQTTVLVQNAKVAPPNIGPTTNIIAYGFPGTFPNVSSKTYEAVFVDDAATSRVTSLGNGEGRVFAGVRDDGFFVDLGQIFDLARLRPVVGGTPRNSVQYTNVMAIALEIPLPVANGGAIANDGTPSANQTAGVWASASRQKVEILRKDGTVDTHGPWRQVSRLGLPLINEAVIGLQDKDKYNRLTPSDDLTTFGAYFLNPVVVRDAEALGYYGAGGPLNACIGLNGNDLNKLKTGRQDIIDVINAKDFPTPGAHAGITSIGDVLRVDLGIDEGGFPNGRALPGYSATSPYDPDVTDIELTLLLCGAPGVVATCLTTGCAVGDGVNQDERPLKATFPYLGEPWEGFSAGVSAAPN